MFNFDFKNFRNTKENAKLIEQRREKIVEMRESGISFGEIGKYFGIKPSTCAKIYKRAIAKSGHKPKSLVVASFVKNVIRDYLPYLILKDGHNVKINYPLLFLILSSKNDYFRSEKAKGYVRVIAHMLKPEIMLTYNRLLSRFGDRQLAENWIRSDKATVPNCFWNNKELEDFLLRCDSIGVGALSKETINNVMEVINKSVKDSPSFKVSQAEIIQAAPIESVAFDSPKEDFDAILKEVHELQGYIEILKEDNNSSREDFMSVLDVALSCLLKVESKLASTPRGSSEELSEGSSDLTPKAKVKVKPKAFWPKPKV